MSVYEKEFIISQDAVRKYAKEVVILKSRLEEAENLLREIKTTNSHYQIIHRINVFFGEEGEIIILRNITGKKSHTFVKNAIEYGNL